jgi:hypothetical protein
MIDAPGEFPLTRAAAVKQFYMQRCGWSEADVITNILKPYKCKATTNYSKVDPESIMMWAFDLFRSIQELTQPFTCRYPLQATLNKENVDILPNNDLSDIDKAYMAINYPRDLSSVEKAFETIDLDSNTKSAIIAAYKKHDILEMRRLLGAHSSSFSSRRPFFGTSQPVVAITRTIRRLPASFANYLGKSYRISDNAQGDDHNAPLLSRDAQAVENGFDPLLGPES